MNYQRTINELDRLAVKWWPAELIDAVAAASLVPLLIESQERFLAVLKLSGDAPEQVFDVLAAAGMPANLFLKHLAVLADYGGEPISRLGREFAQVFPPDPATGTSTMHYHFRQQPRTYAFRALPRAGLSNTRLKLDGVGIAHAAPLSEVYRDLAMILLHGASSTAAEMAALDKCEIGLLLGEPEALERYVKEKYLHVSRITTGAGANQLGQIAQTWVLDALRKRLPDTISLVRNGAIALAGYDKPGGMPFDIVAAHGGKKTGIEVSFQVTTNSVIERKAGQAPDRQTLMHRNGHRIAYVIDGAGNFQRHSAVSKLCQYSDCSVAYSQSEMDVLASFVRETLDA